MPADLRKAVLFRPGSPSFVRHSRRRILWLVGEAKFHRKIERQSRERRKVAESQALPQFCAGLTPILCDPNFVTPILTHFLLLAAIFLLNSTSTAKGAGRHRQFNIWHGFFRYATLFGKCKPSRFQAEANSIGAVWLRSIRSLIVDRLRQSKTYRRRFYAAT